MCRAVPEPCPRCWGVLQEQEGFGLLPHGVAAGSVPREQALWQVLVPSRWASRVSPGDCPVPRELTATPSPLSFPPTVTSEQIEHLHRRFKQLSRDQLTIRYGASVSTPAPPRAAEGACSGCPAPWGCEDKRVLLGWLSAAWHCEEYKEK